MTKRMGWALLAVLLVCIGFAVAVRFSYVDVETDELADFEISGSLGYESMSAAMPNLEAAAKTCDAVCIGTFTGERVFTDEKIFSEIRVEAVLQGEIPEESFILQDEISIIYDMKYIALSGGRLPMKAGDRYLLLVNKAITLVTDSDSPYANRAMYTPFHRSAFGCYDLDAPTQEKLYVPYSGVKMSETYDNPQIWAEDQDMLDKYNRFREEALDWAASYLSE